MHILITGASGLIGTALSQHLMEEGHSVTSLSLHNKTTLTLTDTYDAVVHLAGEPIGDERWTASKKRKIIDSRINGTKLLVDALRQSPPKVLISASAIGFYGDRGETLLDETSETGNDFVSEVTRVWEAEADKANHFTRVVKIRTGLVLAKHGGALAQMLPFFKMGLGGKVGHATQYWSWISLKDEVRAIAFLINNTECAGVYNLVSPTPIDNAGFTKALGQVMNRPTFMSVPEFMVKLKFGDMATELLLGSTRVVPNRLLEAGFIFKDKVLTKTLEKLLN